MKKFLYVICVCISIMLMPILAACGNSAPSYVRQFDYAESVERINNPDQGFYRPIYVKATESGVTYNKNIVTSATQLYHLRIDISAFSAAVNGERDKELSAATLGGLDELLAYLKQLDKNAIVRFAYDPSFGGSKDKEPSLSVMLGHIGQVCSVIDGYGNTVTAIEAGLIGPWGEMHSSAVADASNITPIIDAFLSGVHTIPVLVRTPKMTYDYLGITINDIDGYRVDPNSEAYRLGLYNDGYLGSSSDLGTYTDRDMEVEFLSGQTGHLPYGGEVVVPSSELHDIQNCLTEMNKLDLSYLNVEWNNEVIDKWKGSYYTDECGSDVLYYGRSAFDYIENHLGYRFVLARSVFTYGKNLDKLSVELTFNNVGFGNLNRSKRAKLILVGENGEIVYTQNVSDFKGAQSFGFSVDTNLELDNYDVYLRVYGEESDGVPLYCLQFANDGLWNAELKANRIGRIEAE